MSEEKTLFQILSTVVYSRTITDVSNKLFLSQPYVSRTIHSAEEKYHTHLVKRTPLPIELTLAGQTLKNDLEKLLTIHNKITLDMSNFSTENTSPIRLAFHQPLETVKISEIMNLLIRKFPHISFDANEITASLAEKKLETHQIDIFVGEEFNNDSIRSQIAYMQKLYFIIPQSSSLFNPAITKGVFKQDDLPKINNQNFVNLRDDSFFQQMINNLFYDKGITVKSKIKVSNTIAATQLAGEGLGITISLYDLVKNFVHLKNVNILEIPFNLLHLDIAVSYNKDSSYLIQTVGNYLLNLLHELAKS